MDGALRCQGLWSLVRIFLVVFLLACLGKQSFAKVPDLRVGDVILIEIDCYICRAISKATKSSYNHSGLVVEISEKGPLIAQSLSKVEVVEWDRFLKQAKKNSTIAHLRTRELAALYWESPGEFSQKTTLMLREFNELFLGLPFDSAYMWHNVSSTGEELLYCSEMIQKTLNRILERPLATISMDFSEAYDAWNEYFRGQVPQGQEGNSPSSLYLAPEMMVVGEGKDWHDGSEG